MTTDHAPEQQLRDLLEFLKSRRGLDLTGYKAASLGRRVQKRMQHLRVSSYEEYIAYLDATPEEFEHLFNTVLINVTAFFRDGVPWDYLQNEIVPRIVSAKGAGDPIRVWSAGCASGEEAYTLAMVLAEALGFEAFTGRVKIYATDVDEQALTSARQATYTTKEVEGVPLHLLEKYFEQHDTRYVFRKDLRRLVVFGRNDLIQDAPISRIDLLVCRNTLMYFNASTQAKILSRFHFALAESGYLFLGRAETLLTHTGLFTPVDLKRRVFMKVPRAGPRARPLVMPGDVTGDGAAGAPREVGLQEAAWKASPVPQIVVDTTGVVCLANEPARALLHLGDADIGRPFQDLDISYRPADLRSLLDRAQGERRSATLHSVEWAARGGDARWLDIRAFPLLDEGVLIGVGLTFDDVTAVQNLHRALAKTNSELEGAYEELQSTNEELETTNEELQSTVEELETTNEELQSTNEELETTNEELQSTVEELETTNEELQSTNEELETMNEELQSTNEELVTINDELRRRSDELNAVNDFIESVLTGLRGAVIVLDRELRVEAWNVKAYDLWGITANEARGVHFMMLDIGLPVQELAKPVRACLAGETESAESSLEATNRRGKGITCHVTCTPLRTASDRRIRGVILFMEDVTAQTA